MCTTPKRFRARKRIAIATNLPDFDVLDCVQCVPTIRFIFLLLLFLYLFVLVLILVILSLLFFLFVLAGIPVILIPFSFDFVDALCVATILGFLCGIGNTLMSRNGLDAGNTVKKIQVGITEDMIQGYKTRCSSIARSKERKLSNIGDTSTSTQRNLPRIASATLPSGTKVPIETRGRKGWLKVFARHKVLPDKISSSAVTPQPKKQETRRFEVEEDRKTTTGLRCFDLCKSRRQPPFDTTANDLGTSESNVELDIANRVLPYSASSSFSRNTSFQRSTPRELRQVDSSTRSKLRIVTVPIEQPRKGGYRKRESSTTELGNGQSVHWKLALIATAELALKVLSDQLK